MDVNNTGLGVIDLKTLYEANMPKVVDYSKKIRRLEAIRKVLRKSAITAIVFLGSLAIFGCIRYWNTTIENTPNWFLDSFCTAFVVGAVSFFAWGITSLIKDDTVTKQQTLSAEKGSLPTTYDPTNPHVIAKVLELIDNKARIENHRHIHALSEVIASNQNQLTQLKALATEEASLDDDLKEVSALQRADLQKLIAHYEELNKKARSAVDAANEHYQRLCTTATQIRVRLDITTKNAIIAESTQIAIVNDRQVALLCKGVEVFAAKCQAFCSSMPVLLSEFQTEQKSFAELGLNPELPEAKKFLTVGENLAG